MAKRRAFPLCEATRAAPAEVSIQSDDPNYPFRICKDAAHRLKSFALTPLEYFRLAALHGRDFLLNEDFYDADGVAQQPGVPVPMQPGERMPKFQEVQNNLDDLLDYYFNRFDTDQRSLNALSQFDKVLLFQNVERRLGRPPRKGIEGAVYVIYERLLPEQIAANLGEKWNNVREDSVGSLSAVAELAAASVPAVGVSATLTFLHQTVDRLKWPDARREHAPVYFLLPFHLSFHLHKLLPTNVFIDLLLKFMDKLPSRRRAEVVLHALTKESDERVLDWIERNAVPPITYEWGTTAACNQPTWSRLANWLDRGRPLSLIALDALKNCRGYDPEDESMSGVFRTISPKVLGSVSLSAVRTKLNQYLHADAVPRVKNAVGIVLANLDKIFAEIGP